MVLRAFDLLCEDPNADSLMSCAERVIHEFIRPLLHISRNCAIIENDQCICSRINITDNLEPIINLALEWS